MKKVDLDTVVEIINSCIDGESINPQQYDVNLQELGLDSIGFVRAVILLEKEFECEIPDELLLMSELDTILNINSALEFLFRSLTESDN